MYTNKMPIGSFITFGKLKSLDMHIDTPHSCTAYSAIIMEYTRTSPFTIARIYQLSHYRITCTLALQLLPTHLVRM
jgi:hypothetical protein